MSETDVLSPEKQQQILRGAAEVFAQDGYEGASMSRIAACAGVSKGTLYNYFDSKADMFAAWVGLECSHMLRQAFDGHDPNGDPEVVLRHLGMCCVEMMVSTTGLTMYRVAVSEANKFPEVARAFYEAGPKRGIACVAEWLRGQTEGGPPARDGPGFCRRAVLQPLPNAPGHATSSQPAGCPFRGRDGSRRRCGGRDVPQPIRRAPMTSPLPAILEHIEAGLDATRDRWFDLLRIPSVSAQPVHAPDCVAAAEWLREALAAIGFEAKLVPTKGHPVVLAHHAGTAPGPRLLYYGHYDVQPVEPLALWHSPPFEPVLSEGPRGPRITARGAVDDKGQVMMWLEALRAWHAVAGGPPMPVTVLIEGEEEVGSLNLEPMLAEYRDALAADIAIISDTGMWDVDTPAITTRLRGMVYVELTLHAAQRDLHSGLYGGSALNPINALTRILGALHDADGGCSCRASMTAWRRSRPSRRAPGTRWASTRPRSWAISACPCRPASGAGRRWTGCGRARPPTSTASGAAIPAPAARPSSPLEASAKVSFRLVPGQDPAAVFASFKRFVAERTPADARVDVTRVGLRARHRDRLRQPLGARGPGGAGRRIWPPGGADGQRRLHPGGGEHAPADRGGLAADGVRPRRRPGAQPEREVRVALLPSRPAQPCPVAGQALGVKCCGSGGGAAPFNVQKVLWLIGELGLPHESIDAGGPAGGLDAPASSP